MVLSCCVARLMFIFSSSFLSAVHAGEGFNLPDTEVEEEPVCTTVATRLLIVELCYALSLPPPKYIPYTNPFCFCHYFPLKVFHLNLLH